MGVTYVRVAVLRAAQIFVSVIARACRCDHTGRTVSRLSKSNKRTQLHNSPVMGSFVNYLERFRLQ